MYQSSNLVEPFLESETLNGTTMWTESLLKFCPNFAIMSLNYYVLHFNDDSTITIIDDKFENIRNSHITRVCKLARKEWRLLVRLQSEIIIK